MSTTRRGTARLSCAAALLALLSGCGMEPAGAPAPSPTGSAPPPYTIKDGHFAFTVLELRCGLTAVFGSHAEGTPDGQFCRSRIRIVNDSPEAHTYVSARQLLATSEGDARPDPFAMAVRRQLDSVPIGARNVVELEVWWDVAKDARVRGVKVAGDRDPTGFQNASPVPYVPGGALIPITPAS